MLETGRALCNCGEEILRDPSRVAHRKFETDGARMETAIKSVGAEEHQEAARGIVFRILIRVDRDHAGRILRLGGRELDRWLAERQRAIDALWAGPFDGLNLRASIDDSRGDSWSHLFDCGKWRAAQWFAERRAF